MDDGYVRWVAGVKGSVVVEDSAAIYILYSMAAHTATFSGGSATACAEHEDERRRQRKRFALKKKNLINYGLMCSATNDQ